VLVLVQGGSLGLSVSLGLLKLVVVVVVWLVVVEG
jgi:hypothetical protein